MKIVKKQNKDLKLALYFLTVLVGIFYLAFGVFLPKLNFWGVLFFVILCSTPFAYGAWSFIKFYFMGGKVKEPIDKLFMKLKDEWVIQFSQKPSLKFKEAFLQLKKQFRFI